MDLYRSREQEDIGKAVREFALREFDPQFAIESEQNSRFPHAIWRKACDLGLKGIDLPEKYGGQGYGFSEKLVTLYELAAVNSSLGIAIGLADIGARLILRLGDERQKALLLPPVVKGDSLLSLVVEPPAKNVLPDLVLERVGDQFVVQGKKEYVVNGAVANRILLVMADEGHPEGPSVFCLSAEHEGLHRQDLPDPIGLKASQPATLVFDKVRLEECDLLRGSRHGTELLSEFIIERKMETAFQALAIAENGFGKALDYARKREQFRTKIIEFQAIQLILAGMATRLEAAKGFRGRVVDLLNNQKTETRRAGALVTMFKGFAVETSTRVTLDAIRVLGAYGLVADYHLEEMFRDAVALGSMEGDAIEEQASVGAGLAEGLYQ